MRVPVEWLAEYVDLPAGVTGAQIAADLVRVGLEEEALHGAGIRGPLVAGRIEECVREPQKNGKTISWCQVDVGTSNGTGEPQGIVCGADNVEDGAWVVVILPGGVLPGDLEISARRTYGHVSAGMICSALELGLGEDHEGIVRLEEVLAPEELAALAPGDDLVPVLGLDREVVEVNVTPDRGYCFSVRGIAREYSHSTGATFHDPAAGRRAATGERVPLTPAPASDQGFAVLVEDDAPLEAPGCDRFVARVVRGLDPQAPSPRWLTTRLREAGMRPISLAVDVSNYVMLALGQPTHTYDLAPLAAPVVVRRARAGERLTTLDDVERDLDPQDLLITDTGGERLLGLAGVMGGAASEVGPETTDVLVEAAHFDQRTVARTARRHRLGTEASKRFERGVDPDLPDVAAQLVVDLLVELGGGRADPAVTDLDARTGREEIDLDLDLPTRYVGVDYPPDRVREILRLIGCEVRDGDDAGQVRVLPASWRPDLRDAPDLVEEVARIDGYDAIPSVLPTPSGGRGLTHHQRARRTVAAALAGQGLVEVLTYPFVSETRFAELGLAGEDPRRAAVRLANPLSAEAPLLRTELLQTLPEALRRNVARGSRDVALFELDTVSRPRRGGATRAPVPGVGALPDETTLGRIRAAVPDQPWHLALVAAGEVERGGWSGPGRAADAVDASAWAHAVCDSLGVTIERLRTEREPFHPGRCVELALPDGTTVGWAGELHPQVVQRLGLPERTVAAELDLDVLIAAADHRVLARPLSTHPLATSDVALTVARTVASGDVEESLRAGAGELLETLRLFDVYRGDQVGPEQRSLAYRLGFRAPDRTLRTEEVNAARDAAVARAAADHGAEQR